MMTHDDLLAEAKRLSRQCIHLVRDNKFPVAGVWGGEASGIENVPHDHRHWLTVATRFIPGVNSLPAGISVFTNEDDCETGLVATVASLDGMFRDGSDLLYAKPAVSLPPLDAIFRFGNESVQHWLKQLGWEPDWGYNSNFPDAAITEEYELSFQQSCPIYGNGVCAVLGGWHFVWPDGDWDDLVDASLLVWTIDESEPWVEAWLEHGKTRVIQRIT